MPHRPPYPLPTLDHALKHIHGGVFALLTPQEVPLYEQAVRRVLLPQDSNYRREVEKYIEENWTGQDNWCSEWFLNLLLGVRTPISGSQILCARLEVPKYLLGGGSPESYPQNVTSRLMSKPQQTHVTALLLYALARFAIRPRSSYTPIELALAKQLSGLIGTVRIPGRISDELQTTETGQLRYVLVWTKGRAWMVDILRVSGDVVEVVGLNEIEKQLEDVLRMASEGCPANQVGRPSLRSVYILKRL